jgi:hypothetical protein
VVVACWELWSFCVARTISIFRCVYCDVIWGWDVIH